MTELLAGGRYTLVRRLAQGGMGDVLLADFRGDQALGLGSGLVVLKRVLPDHPNRGSQAAMLREEGRVGMRLLHDNLVETFFVDEHKGDPLLVMEYLSGRAMSQVLGQAKKRKERIPVEVALAILRASACGLHFAHTLTDRGRPLGLIHRDVSPANIFVTFDGRVKVIDFGVAKASDSEIRTSTGILKGKLGYMSPEHALGEQLSPAADLWSLGVCFWETLCAERLFASASPSATLQAIADKPVPSPRVHRPDLPVHIEALCMRLLERRIENRISTGAALVKAIDALPESALLARLDLGGWLSTNFPEEAEVGRNEARHAARLRRKHPVPIGLVEGTAAQGPSESDAPTVVIGAAQAQQARAEAQAAVPDDDVATVRMKLGEMVADSISELSAEEENAPTRKIVPANFLADPATQIRRNDDALAPTTLTPMPTASPVSSSPSSTSSTSSTSSPSSTSTPAARPITASRPITALNAPGSSGQSGQTAAMVSVTIPVPAPASSWVGVALLTFGALAVAMGVAFSFLAPPLMMRAVVAYEDPTGTWDIVVAQRDAPPGARVLDVARPSLKVSGAVKELDPAELDRKLTASGVRLRASLPSTPRATLALLLPVVIAGLGLLALAGALPAVVLASSPKRRVAQGALFLVAVLALGAVLKVGALSWPGLDAWKRVPRLEMKS